jgi:hypothetical protein
MFEANAGPAPAVGVATAIAYALIVTPAIGTERRQDLRRELVGSWRLVSFEVRNAKRKHGRAPLRRGRRRQADLHR